ncbi:hypothetical protein FRC12_001372 [Ceratobasidium sp. 428]|nr:hypothetical protein FRC12_001372 [Ceratobasidium sp. 428]
MSNNLLHPDVSNLPYYVATYKGRSVAIKRDPDYQNTIKLVQKSIPKLRSIDGRDVFLNTALENYGGALVQISEEIWPDVVDQVKMVEVSLDVDDNEYSESTNMSTGRVSWIPQGRHSEMTAANVNQEQDMLSQYVSAAADRSTVSSGVFSVIIRAPSQKLLTINDLRLSTRVGHIKSLIETEYNIPVNLQRFDLLGERLDDMKTLEQSRVTEQTILDLVLYTRRSAILVTRGATLDPRDIEIRYSRNLAWELLAHYPSIEAPSLDYIHTITWKVDVTNELAYSLGRESQAPTIASLYWDGVGPQPYEPSADTLSISLDRSATSSPANSSLVSNRLLNPNNSSIVYHTNFDSRIVSSLRHIGLDVSGQAFRDIMLQVDTIHSGHIAFRLIRLGVSDAMSSLSTVPATPKILRILLLYRRLSSSTVGIWNLSAPRKDRKDSSGTKLITPEWHQQAGFAVFEITWMELY